MDGADVHLPRVGRWLLRLMPLGNRRADVEADLLDLLAHRTAQRGRRYAARRLYRDLLSVFVRVGSTHTARFTRVAVLNGAGQDFRHATRLARRHPVLVTAAALSIALAIGTGTAVFSVLNSTFFRWYLASDASVVQVWRRHANGASRVWPATEFLELRRHAKTISLEGYVAANLPVSTSEDRDAGETVAVNFASGRYFDTFGASAAAGRLIGVADDDRGPPIVVLDHRFWHQRFGAGGNVIGRTLWLAGSPVVIGGVLGRDFDNHPFGSRPAIWAALAAIERVTPATAPNARVTMFGRVVAGSAAPRVDAELTALLKDLAIPLGASVRPATRVETAPAITADAVAQLRVVVVSVIGVVALLLLLACANISNLLLASAAQRSHEIGVRLALGADRARVFRQLLIESGLLSAAGAGGGLVLSIWMAPVLAGLSGLQTWDVARDIAPDTRVYVFLVASFGLFSVLAGLAPARFASRGDVTWSLTGPRPAGSPGVKTRPAARGAAWGAGGRIDRVDRARIPAGAGGHACRVARSRICGRGAAASLGLVSIGGRQRGTVDRRVVLGCRARPGARDTRCRSRRPVRQAAGYHARQS